MFRFSMGHDLIPVLQKPANILVMGEGPERGRVKIGEWASVAGVGPVAM